MTAPRAAFPPMVIGGYLLAVSYAELKGLLRQAQLEDRMRLLKRALAYGVRADIFVCFEQSKVPIGGRRRRVTSPGWRRAARAMR